MVLIVNNTEKIKTATSLNTLRLKLYNVWEPCK